MIENYKKKETVFKIKKSIKQSKKTKNSKKIPFTNESGISMQSNYLMNKNNSNKTKKKYS